MTAELLVILAAIVIPIVTVLALVRLVTGLEELERSRDDLIELRADGGR
jgi:hypothetical protein